MLRYLIVLAVLLGAYELSAQNVEDSLQNEVKFSVDFQTFADNREGQRNGGFFYANTFLLTRLSPELSVSFEDGKHVVSAGTAAVVPIGNSWKDTEVKPILNYRYSDGPLNVWIGMLPRQALIERQPHFLMGDSASYHNPTIRGALFQYVKPRKHVELMVDWRQQRTQVDREMFSAYVNGNAYLKNRFPLYVGAMVDVTHFGLANNSHDIGESVNDDITLHPYLGLNLSHKVSLDSLELRVGSVSKFSRDRNPLDNKWRTGSAFYSKLHLGWKCLNITETFSCGDGFMPLFSKKYGTVIYNGTPLYRTKYYSRTDIAIKKSYKKYLEFQGDLSVHVTDRIFSCWQQITVRLNTLVFSLKKF